MLLGQTEKDCLIPEVENGVHFPVGQKQYKDFRQVVCKLVRLSLLAKLLNHWLLRYSLALARSFLQLIPDSWESSTPVCSVYLVHASILLLSVRTVLYEVLQPLDLPVIFTGYLHILQFPLRT